MIEKIVFGIVAFIFINLAVVTAVETVSGQKVPAVAESRADRRKQMKQNKVKQK